MKENLKRMCIFILSVTGLCSCEIIDNDSDKHVQEKDSTYVRLSAVAEILSAIPIDKVHLEEVHDAVSSSSVNGYDEEYTMKNLFTVPGSGVGDDLTKAGTRGYSNPLRDLIADHVYSMAATRAASGSDMSPEDYLGMLTESDVQIYWPFSEEWDGSTMPVITFDPEDGADANIGYRLEYKDDGSRHVQKVIVDEEMAREQPVWVVNRNSDAGYTTLEMLRREDPDWGEGGGTIIVKPSSADGGTHAGSSGQKADTKAAGVRTLLLKEFTMKRNYDSWFAGASEFWVKTGAVEDFTASTEAEMKLYAPSVTDFMIVVKRSQMGKPQPFNAILVSEWTDQMLNCALLISEDDGGTRTDWNCTAVVKVGTKSYGIELKIPFNTRDDIVWRGQLSGKWLEQNSNIVGHFGDVDLTFEVL
ncbi:MAG: hypothetical protein IJ394_01110 [Bacteroidales bacterium]|nr:hypothetical protein [Bacteroidales bacterium]